MIFSYADNKQRRRRQSIDTLCEELFSSVQQTTDFPGGKGKEKMATEGHRQGPRGDRKKMRKEEMDK
jgi:hypothetical protein